MPSALLTPRAEPGHLLPAIAGGTVLLLALPVFLIAGWPIKGWALATVLYAGVHVLDVWGDAGAHARSAIGVAELPFDWPVEVEAIVSIE